MNLVLINDIDVVLWVIFIGWWAVSAFNVKKNVKGSNEWIWWFISRIVLVVLIIAVFGSFGSFFKAAGAIPVGIPLGGSLVTAILGLVFVAAGIAFAIWARIHLGRNWS